MDIESRLSTLALPPWVESFRSHQITAIEEIVDAYERGADVVVLDAPTGSGKTLIAESVRQLLEFGPVRTHDGIRGECDGPTRNIPKQQHRSVYVCTTKSLQAQFARDYPYARLLKGRSNYPTELYPDKYGANWDSLSCEDCTKMLSADRSCKWCSSVDSCPYEMAKDEAVRAELAVLNTSYFLTEANYIGRMSGRDLVIADECDLLDQAVTDHVSVEINERRLKLLGIGGPRYVTKPESWVEWAAYATPAISAGARAARLRARDTGSPRDVKMANSLSNLARRMHDLDRGLKEGGWVYTGTRDRVEFKPVWADGVAREALWKHGKKWLLMSATVINAETLLSALGWEDGTTTTTVMVPSTFPVENRPIFVRPVANMKASEAEVEREKLVPAIERIAADHPGERILVHTVSYSLTAYLHKELARLPRTVLRYAKASDRDSALATYLATPGAILLAPSLDRGVDLPGDACRVQVIAKVPFPNLGDKRVSARLYGSGSRGQLDYTVQTVRTLVQMTGRGVRSEIDTCTSYILDRQFELKLWGSNRRLFPQYWRNALKWRQ